MYFLSLDAEGGRFLYVVDKMEVVEVLKVDDGYCGCRCNSNRVGKLRKYIDYW